MFNQAVLMEDCGSKKLWLELWLLLSRCQSIIVHDTKPLCSHGICGIDRCSLDVHSVFFFSLKIIHHLNKCDYVACFPAHVPLHGLKIMTLTLSLLLIS